MDVNRVVDHLPMGRVLKGNKKLEIAGIDFDGSYGVDTTTIPANKAAVYVIICSTKEGKNYVIDVGESGETGVRLSSHDRRSCWERNCSGTLRVYLRYMPSSEGYAAADRRQLEQKIRQQYDPPCGKI